MDAHLLLSGETFCQNTGNVFYVKETLFLTSPFDNPIFVFCPYHHFRRMASCFERGD